MPVILKGKITEEAEEELDCKSMWIMEEGEGGRAEDYEFLGDQDVNFRVLRGIGPDDAEIAEALTHKVEHVFKRPPPTS